MIKINLDEKTLTIDYKDETRCFDIESHEISEKCISKEEQCFVKYVAYVYEDEYGNHHEDQYPIFAPTGYITVTSLPIECILSIINLNASGLNILTEFHKLRNTGLLWLNNSTLLDDKLVLASLSAKMKEKDTYNVELKFSSVSYPTKRREPLKPD